MGLAIHIIQEGKVWDLLQECCSYRRIYTCGSICLRYLLQCSRWPLDQRHSAFLAYELQKKFKSGESKLRIGKDTTGNRTCVAVKPSKLSSSSNKTLCIGTKGVQSGHTHTHGDSNANQSEHQQPHTDSHHDQSENPRPQNDPVSWDVKNVVLKDGFKCCNDYIYFRCLR